MTEPEPETITDINVLEEATFAALCAIAEQLDLDRLQRSLLLQHDTIASSGMPRCEDVAAVLFRFGRAVIQIEALRDSKRTPSH